VDLQSRWFGDFIVLWRLPPSFNGAIKLGTSGPDVQWLASQLAAISGQILTSNTMISYDTDLIRQVKSFQVREGLESDGIAGLQTLMRINSVIDEAVPRLSGTRGKPGSPASQSPGKQSASNIDFYQRGQLAQAD
jgi:general secretion pathway protein A